MQHQYNTLALPETSPNGSSVATEPETVWHASGGGATLRCPHQGDGHLSEPTAHALIDHLLLIETELAQIRRLLLEEIGL
jgi:hypothetical protein